MPNSAHCATYGNCVNAATQVSSSDSPQAADSAQLVMGPGMLPPPISLPPEHRSTAPSKGPYNEYNNNLSGIDIMYDGGTAVAGGKAGGVGDRHPSPKHLRGQQVNQQTAVAKPQARQAHVLRFAALRSFFLSRRTLQTKSDEEVQPEVCKDKLASTAHQHFVWAKEIDRGIQAIRSTTTSSTQTQFHRKVDHAVQVDPPLIDATLRFGERPQQLSAVKGDTETENAENTQSNVAAGHKKGGALTTATAMMRMQPHASPNRIIIDVEADEQLRNLCSRKAQMLHYLRQSYQIPIFCDDYAHLPEDENFVASRDDHYLREQGNYSSGDYTRGREITCIDWKRGSSAVIVIALKRQMTLQERFEDAANCEKSFAIIWDFREQLNPQFVLEAPAEVLSVKFCPTRQNYIVGCCINGQVCVWDTERVSQEVIAQAGGGNAAKYGGRNHRTNARAGLRGGRDHHHTGAGTGDDTGIPSMAERVPGHTIVRNSDHLISKLSPLLQSKIETQGGGHRRAVHDIQWFPSNVECTLTGRLEERPGQEVQNQFATMSEDGSMCIWDVRPEIFSSNPKVTKLRNSSIGDDKIFIPIYRCLLTAPEGSMGGDVAFALKFHLEGLTPGGVGSFFGRSGGSGYGHDDGGRGGMGGRGGAGGGYSGGAIHAISNNPYYIPFPKETTPHNDGYNPISRLYRMCCTTIEGEFCQCHWGPKDLDRRSVSAAVNAAGGVGGDVKGKDADKVIRSVSNAHFGAALTVQRHPQFRDLYLTVGDCGFKLWKTNGGGSGAEQPILASPYNEDPVLCGRWSPTRASVIFLGTKNGSIQIWDLLDRSHEKLFSMSVTADAITCLEFKPQSDRRRRGGSHGHHQKQMLIASTDKGSFLLFEVPEQLVRPHSHERENCAKFFEREARRVKYFQWRWEVRMREMSQQLQLQRTAGGDKVGGGGDAGAVGGVLKTKGMDGIGGLGGIGNDGDDADDELEYIGTQEEDMEFLRLVRDLAAEDGDVMGSEDELPGGKDSDDSNSDGEANKIEM